MKVTLVGCPVLYSVSPPLSLAVLQAYLKKEKYDVDVIDLSIDLYNKHRRWYKFLEFLFYFYIQKFSRIFYYAYLIPKKHYNEFIESILSSNPNVVCFSVYKYNVLVSIYIANKIKSRNPGMKIVFGGPACYYNDIKKFIIKSKAADYIIDSEGDLMLLEVLKNIQNKKYIIDKKIITDMDTEPLPDFSGFDLEKYKIKRLPYSTTRGCYKRCVYCSDIVFWQKFRYKPAKRIFDDLKELVSLYGINSFNFSDSVMLGSRKNIEELCDLIVKNGLKIKWRGQIRAKGLDDELLKKMKHAGCTNIYVGVESGSQKILDEMNKDCKIGEIQDAIKTASRIGVDVSAMFMIGYPTETWIDFNETIKFVRENRKYISNTSYNLTSILEGTKLYDMSERLGIKRKDQFYWHSKNNNILTRLIRLLIIKFIDLYSIDKNGRQ